MSCQQIFGCPQFHSDHNYNNNETCSDPVLRIFKNVIQYLNILGVICYSMWSAYRHIILRYITINNMFGEGIKIAGFIYSS